MKKYSLLLLFVAITTIAFAWNLRGVHKIVKVHDGDTVTLDDNTIIRLNQIDAVELDQPMGDSAQMFAASYLLGKSVRIVKHGKDIYSRTIGDIYLPDGTYFNELLVKKGYAWTTKYTSRKRLVTDMNRAMKNQIGLWKYPHISPYEWRKEHKK